MPDKTAIGNRMKRYEAASKTFLTPRMPFIVRVDGKAFHSYSKGFEKPWDGRLVKAMDQAARALVREIQGAKLAFVQSDEISVLATDYDKIESSSWFDKNVQKIASVSASIATAAFNLAIESNKIAYFDSRCFVIPKEEVCNAFIWRQQDSVRNSIMGLAQKHFSHKELHGINCNQAQEKLFQERAINWNDCETWQKRGWCVIRKTIEIEQENSEPIIRTVIESDWDIPTFTQDRNFIEKFI